MFHRAIEKSTGIIIINNLLNTYVYHNYYDFRARGKYYLMTNTIPPFARMNKRRFKKQNDYRKSNRYKTISRKL